MKYISFPKSRTVSKCCLEVNGDNLHAMSNPVFLEK